MKEYSEESNLSSREENKESRKLKMEHGAGGELMTDLIKNSVIKKLTRKSAGGIGLDELDDGATIPFKNENIVITTDSHVVNPLFFPGGDIGRLAVSGTVNDLAMMGAKPIALTNSIIVEEGFDINKLEDVIKSMDKTCSEVGIPIVTGDTKVLGSGEIDGLVINTTGIGYTKKVIPDSGLGPNDHIIISGTVGDHGMTLMSSKEGFTFKSDISSDVRPINNIIEKLLSTENEIKVSAMKDPTRGGVATALNDMARKSNYGIIIKEDNIPINKGVKSASEMLGLDPLEVANEGIFIAGVRDEDSEEALELIRSFEEGKNAQIIGNTIDEWHGKVLLETSIGGKRFVESPKGDPVPRVC